MPVILYARVSRADDPAARSVDDQLAHLREWAAREGWEILAEYRDDSVSASRYTKTRRRTGWEEAVADLSSGRLRGGALLVWEFSRASRDKKVSAALEAACISAGVRLGYKGELRDPATADGGFTVGLDALLAARESDVTAERVKRAVDSRAAAGRPHGRALFGYKRVIDPNTGKTTGRVVDPETGPVVKDILKRLVAGEPVAVVTRDLNDRGIPATGGGPWLATNVSKLAQRPGYAGLVVHNGKVLDGVEATWPPLISVAEHYALVARFTAPDLDKYRTYSGVRRLGSGIFRCGREGCDGRMRVVVAKRRADSYNCKVCHKVSRRVDRVDELVEEVMVSWLERPDVWSRLAERSEAPPEARTAAETLIRERTRLAELREAWGAGDITTESFKAMEPAALARIEAAEQAAKVVPLPRGVADTAGPEARARWAELPILDKREAVAAVLDVTILPAGKGAHSWDPTRVRITER